MAAEAEIIAEKAAIEATESFKVETLQWGERLGIDFRESSFWWGYKHPTLIALEAKRKAEASKGLLRQ